MQTWPAPPSGRSHRRLRLPQSIPAHAHSISGFQKYPKMAESSSSSSSKTKFFCELCQLGFHFASKYHAHLGSSNHKALQEIFNIKLPPEITKEAGATQGALVGTEGLSYCLLETKVLVSPCSCVYQAIVLRDKCGRVSLSV